MGARRQVTVEELEEQAKAPVVAHPPSEQLAAAMSDLMRSVEYTEPPREAVQRTQADAEALDES